MMVSLKNCDWEKSKFSFIKFLFSCSGFTMSVSWYLKQRRRKLKRCYFPVSKTLKINWKTLQLNFECCFWRWHHNLLAFPIKKKNKTTIHVFSNFYNSQKSSLGSCEVPQKIWVQSFWRFTVTNKQTNTQTEKQNRYGLAFVHSCIWLRFSSLDGKTISWL